MSRQNDPRQPRTTDGTQSPVRDTRINPQAEAAKVPAGALSSRSYIAKFDKADTQPVAVVDDESAIRRNRQIITICKRLCPMQTRNATDAQILGLHRSFMSGRL